MCVCALPPNVRCADQFAWLADCVAEEMSDTEWTLLYKCVSVCETPPSLTLPRVMCGKQKTSIGCVTARAPHSPMSTLKQAMRLVASCLSHGRHRVMVVRVCESVCVALCTHVRRLTRVGVSLQARLASVSVTPHQRGGPSMLQGQGHQTA